MLAPKYHLLSFHSSRKKGFTGKSRVLVIYNFFFLCFKPCRNFQSQLLVLLVFFTGISFEKVLFFLISLIETFSTSRHHHHHHFFLLSCLLVYSFSYSIEAENTHTHTHREERERERERQRERERERERERGVVAATSSHLISLSSLLSPFSHLTLCVYLSIFVVVVAVHYFKSVFFFFFFFFFFCCCCCCCI